LSAIFVAYFPEESWLPSVCCPIAFRKPKTIHRSGGRPYRNHGLSVCPSCFNLALKGRYDCLDGLFIPHTCDTLERLFVIWQETRPAPLTYLLNVPHMTGLSSEAFFYGELKAFIAALETWSGQTLDTTRLREAVRVYNRRRAALRDLYELRKSDPPLVSGSEVMETVVAGMGIPATEHIELINEFIDEVRSRGKADKGAAPPYLPLGQ
jgi:benzoyl-CoA reductase/2-hydroxyglutaryl-CoA dehydratase subunit BcrC/BadD/HgdB